MQDKDINRHKHSTWILGTVVFLSVSVVILALLGKVTSEFNFALGAILGYAGNHTIQNYRTAPKKEVSDE